MQISRRSFLQGAATTAAAGATVALSTAPAMADETAWAAEADYIIVGTGAAGLAAAITVYHENLGDALVLEVAPEEEMGGNSRCCGQGVFAPDSPEAAIEYQTALSLPYAIEEDTMAAWAEELCKNEEWLIDVCGAELKKEVKPEFPEMPGGEHVYLINPTAGRNTDGNGTLWLNMYYTAQDLDVPFQFDTRVVRLIKAQDGEIHGVIDEAGNCYKARKAVILACGGFEGSTEMMQANCPCGYEGTRGKGSWWNKGDGIKAAQEAGAALWHMNNFSGNYPGFRCLAADNDDAITWPNFKTHDYIFLDGYGDRYMNEDCMGIGEGLTRHGKIFRHGAYADLDLPTGGWCIFGQNAYDAASVFSASCFVGQLKKAFHMLASNDEGVEAGVIIKCDSLEEVAAATGYDLDHITATIGQYNEFCENNNDEMFHRGQDLGAHGYVVPSPGHENDVIFKKAFDLEKIEAPYYVTEIRNTVLNTQGGPKRNANGQIVNAVDGAPIPRLYGAGEMGAPYPYLYNQGGNFGEAMSSGRIAARHAATLKPWA
ncbi:MAG: FAD-binding protein [Coriobacteriales bacterium]|nr:FAD-binding protein [Coriobacteriales bacterium]